MERRNNRLINKAFENTLLDSPVPNKKVKFSLRGNKPKLETIKLLPDPIKPTKLTPKPIPKPRKKTPKPIPKPRVKSMRPVPLPRTRPLPKPIDKKVKKIIDEITPYYKPEAIEAFNKILKDINYLRVITIKKKKKKALRGAVKAFEVVIRVRKDPARQFYYTTPGVAEELRSIFNTDGAMKAQITLKVLFKKKKISGEGEEVFEYKDAYFNSTAFTILDNDDIIESLDKAAEEINNKIAFWLSEGSGWTIVEIQSHFVNIVKYLPLRGDSYVQLPKELPLEGSSYVQLPKELRNSMMGLINLQNNDDKCFLWDHVRHLNPRKKDPQRITKSDREFAKGLDYRGISFPVTRNQINRIEKQNKINIYVFGYDTVKKSVYPIYPTYPSTEGYDDCLDLLYIEGKNKLGEETTHYVLIKDFNRLMFKFTKHKGKKHFCRNCLQCFYSKESLAKHRVNCIAINGVQTIKMPEKFKDKKWCMEITMCVF